MRGDLARAMLLLAIAGALVASSELLVSNNLLPRRVGLHIAALIALVLAASRPRRLEADGVLVALLGWSLGVWALSRARLAGMTGMLDEAAAVALVFALARAPISRRRLLGLLVGLACLSALLGLVDQWLILPLGSATRPAGLFASRATAGAFFAAALPLTACFLARRPWLASVAIALEAACLVSTRARAAWTAAAIALVVVAVFAPAVRRRVLLAFLVGVTLALLLTPGPTLSWRSAGPYQQSLASLTRLEVGDRASVWRETVRLITDRPWGWGPGSFESEFARDSGLPTEVRIESPHNEPLRLVFELGLPGLALGLLLLRGVRRHASPRTWLLRTSLLALVLCSLTGKTFEEPPTLVLGCCLVALQLRQRSRRWLPGRGVALLGAAAALLVTMMLVDVPQVRASHVLARAQHAARAGNVRAAWELVGPSLADNHDVSAWRWAASLLDEAGDGAHCLAVVDEGLATYAADPLLLAQRARCRER